ncbi:MAG TPA: glycosyltransferase [Candidatus Paceibacterota bacterium]|nr:glycosyltransferase [Candidatus Paceibacterota bacterium]
MNRTLSIVIPCYNEEATLATLLDRVLATSLPGWNKEVIVVDDASTDGTPAILAAYASRITVRRLARNGGKGTAVAEGLGVAAGDFILIQDADLEYAPEEISRLTNAVQDERSVVYGSRNLENPQRTGFWIPRLGVWGITVLINVLYGARLTDAWTCYKLFPASAKRFFPAGRFDAEIMFTLELVRKGYAIDEVPITHSPRDAAHGKKIQYTDGLRVIGLILKDSIQHIRPFWLFLLTLIMLATLSFAVLKPAFSLEGDAPSYIASVQFLQAGAVDAHFVPNRILTTFLGLEAISLLSQVTGGNLQTAWLLLNAIFYVLGGLVFYLMLLTVFRSQSVAFLGGLFLAANYAYLTFGLSYFMDMGGWFFYLLALFFTAYYLYSRRTRHLYWSAVAIGVGVLFKEYALLGVIPLILTVVWEKWPRAGAASKQLIPLGTLVCIPLILLYLYVYLRFGYTYADWFTFNHSYYVYSSRLIEYVKAGGVLVNFLALPVLLGAYQLFVQKGKALARPHRMFVGAVIVSALPAFIWPAITERILFITIPALILIASIAFKRYEQRWFVFLPILGLYGLMSLYMDSVILPQINLPF